MFGLVSTEFVSRSLKVCPDQTESCELAEQSFWASRKPRICSEEIGRIRRTVSYFLSKGLGGERGLGGPMVEELC